MRHKPTRMYFCATLLAALLLAAASSAPRASAQAVTVTTNETIPFTGTITNLCNADAVAFSGNLHMVNHVTTDASGGVHVRTHVNYENVSGTGTPSGAQYRITSTSNEVLNDKEGPQSVMTVVQTVNLISQGSVPNLILRTVFHITINANGVTTSVVDNARIECLG